MNKKRLFDLIEEKNIPLIDRRGVLLPDKLLRLSRESDLVRYWMAEVEEGKLSLIDGMMNSIESLLIENRKLK